jgi:hypothetical protein
MAAKKYFPPMNFREGYFCSKECHSAFDWSKLDKYTVPYILISIDEEKYKLDPEKYKYIPPAEGVELAKKYEVPFFEVNVKTSE